MFRFGQKCLKLYNISPCLFKGEEDSKLHVSNRKYE